MLQGTRVLGCRQSFEGVLVVAEVPVHYQCNAKLPLSKAPNPITLIWPCDELVTHPGVHPAFAQVQQGWAPAPSPQCHK